MFQAAEKGLLEFTLASMKTLFAKFSLDLGADYANERERPKFDQLVVYVQNAHEKLKKHLEECGFEIFYSIDRTCNSPAKIYAIGDKESMRRVSSREFNSYPYILKDEAADRPNFPINWWHE